jgi:hypothetical protein
MTTVKVTGPAELLDALATADDIEVDGSLAGMPMITLRPGVTLRGGTLRFGAKGVRTTSDNILEDMTVIVPDWEVAIGAHGDDVVTLDVEGAIDTLKVQQGITAAGVGSDAIRLTGEVAGLDEVPVTAVHGQRIVSRIPNEEGEER